MSSRVAQAGFLRGFKADVDYMVRLLPYIKKKKSKLGGMAVIALAWNV